MSRRTRAGTVALLAEVLFVTALLAVWLLSPTIRASRHLIVAFLYSFPSEFLIAVVPHEPVLLYFGKYHPAALVALVSVVGTVMTEAINYRVFRVIARVGPVEPLVRSRVVTMLIRHFSRTPGLAVVVAGFTPVPFYPIRILVVLAHYPIERYLAAVFISRYPRFLLLSALGRAIAIPDWGVVAVFGVLLAALYGPLVTARIRRVLRTRGRALTEAAAFDTGGSANRDRAADDRSVTPVLRLGNPGAEDLHGE